MSTALQSLGIVLLFTGCVLGGLLDGPTDTQAAQDVADDATHASQLARDTAACRQHHGPNAQIRMLDSAHLVCRPPLIGPASATTTAKVEP